MAGLPPRYRDSVRQITPGLPLFLYNYSTHQLHGVFEVILIRLLINNSFISHTRSFSFLVAEHVFRAKDRF
ncbi:putative DCD domain-containing protein NRP [Helianthus annuus]|nr:putative DCD domain-containing protein NRP [Helianthus annuus]